MSKNIVAPEDQSVGFVELLFDVVYVFSITQIGSRFHGQFDSLAVIQGIFISWFVWWSWSQLTWSLNIGNTNHRFINFLTLLVTVMAFFMAIIIPNVFGSGDFIFVILYVSTRLIGLFTLIWVSSVEIEWKKRVRVFTYSSSVGLLLILIGGYIGGGHILQYIFWSGAMVIDLIAAYLGSREEGSMRSEHFVERYALFIIIVIGESLIVVANGLSDITLDFEIILIALLAILISCGFWWTYFMKAKNLLAKALSESTGLAQVNLANVVYNSFHFLMILGMVSYGIAIEGMIGHPSTIMSIQTRFALLLGFLLFVGTMVPAMKRANGILLLPRLAICILISLLMIGLTQILPIQGLTIIFSGVLIIAIIEDKSSHLD